MPRITMVFIIREPQVLQDLVREFSHHADVVASAGTIDGRPCITVETHDSATSQWDVRATIGMYDDRATELTDQL